MNLTQRILVRLLGWGRHQLWWVNQPGDTLCYVSPARFASSSLTSAKRITRLILRALRYAGRGNFKSCLFGMWREWMYTVDSEFLTQTALGTVIGLCDRALG